MEAADHCDDDEQVPANGDDPIEQFVSGVVHDSSFAAVVVIDETCHLDAAPEATRVMVTA